MDEVEITFSREGIDGVSPVGATLLSIMRRFGIRMTDDCNPDLGEHHCLVTVTSGESVLSPIGKLEEEHFSKHKRRAGERLGCFAVAAKPGGITIMTAEKRKKPNDPIAEDKMINEFAELPLEDKLAKLVKMEAVALSETISFVLDSPFKVFEKIGDIMADIGMKKDTAPKAAKDSEQTEADRSEPIKDDSKAKKPRRPSRRPASAKATKDADQP